jgi:hemolysin activation/secretion protein
MWGLLSFREILIGVLAFVLLAETGQAATSLRLPSTVEPGHEQPSTTEIPEGQFDFSITAPHKTTVPKDVETLRFLVSKITIEGSTVFQHGDLLPLVEPLVGQQATLRDIMAIAEALETRYREEGFLLTRVLVPPQRTRNGEFKIQVVEGFIKNISVEGVDGELKDQITATLAPTQKERPLTSETMERALLLVNDIPGLHAVGLLKPSSDEAGAADLDVTVSKQTVTASSGIDNRSSRYSGPWIANMDVAVNSLVNGGEQMGAGVSRSVDPHKQRGYRLHYVQPIGIDGLTTTTTFDRTFGQPGYTLAPLEIVTDSIAIGQRLSYPLMRGRRESLFIDGGFTWKSAKTDMLASNVNLDQWRIADIKLSWSQSGWFDGITAGSLGLAKGLPMAGASHPHDLNLSRVNGDPDFTKAVFDIKRIQPLWSDVSLSLAGAGQHSFSGLLAGEEFSLGGYQFGRGFDPSALTGDDGLGGSLELHYDMRTGLPVAETLQTYGFYDQGMVWDHGGGKTATLSSVGVGLRSPLTPNVDISVEAARPLHGPNPTVSDKPMRIFFSLQGKI